MSQYNRKGLGWEKLLQSGELTSGDSHGMVFSFGRGVSYCRLFLYALGNGACDELNEIANGGLVPTRRICSI